MSNLYPTDTMIPSRIESKQTKPEEQDDSSKDKARVWATHLENIVAQDHARQQIGDQHFYGPVTFQHASGAGAADQIAHDKERSGTLEEERSRIIEEERVRKLGEERLRKQKLEEERSRLLESLAFDQMDIRYMNVHSNLVGTCDWLLHTPEYKQWTDSRLMSVHHGFLWIRGKAATGKSTLIKYVAEYAAARSADREHVLSFFFNARGESIETSPNGLFRTMLYQLLEAIPELYEKLDKRRLNVAQRQKWASASLRDVFGEAVMLLDQDRVTCYIDAMDECRYDEIENVVRSIDDLGDSAAAKGRQFYVCLSSRHYPNVKLSSGIELVLEHQMGHDKDIQTYIRKRLMIDDEQLRNDLADAIEIKASGIFLWVVLVVALLNGDDKRGNVHEMHKRLDQLPPTLSELFNELLGRGVRHICLRSLLRLVTFASRPLSHNELYEALLHEFKVATNDRTDAAVVNEETQKRLILDVSKGLVEVVDDTRPRHAPSRQPSRVQFIHESVRTYFLDNGLHHLTGLDDYAAQCTIEEVQTNDRSMLVARCHDLIRQLCLQYLQDVSSQSKCSYCQFLAYAVNGVLDHAARMNDPYIPPPVTMIPREKYVRMSYQGMLPITEMVTDDTLWGFRELS